MIWPEASAGKMTRWNALVSESNQHLKYRFRPSAGKPQDLLAPTARVKDIIADRNSAPYVVDVSSLLCGLLTTF